MEDGSFSFDVGQRMVGYGMAERNEYYFKGCTVKIKIAD